MMPKIAEGDANKVWIVPSEIGKALEGLGSTMTNLQGIPQHVDGPKTRVDMGSTERAELGGSGALADTELKKANAAVEAAIAEAAEAANPRGSVAPARRRPIRPPPAGGAARFVSPFEVVAILLAGVAAGTINTVVGSGTLITFPTLLAFGVPPVTANVSNTIGLVPGSISGAIGYRRELVGQRSRVLRL